jgi:glutamate 5-kinase
MGGDSHGQPLNHLPDSIHMTSPTRIVVKLGTQVVVDQTSGRPALERLAAIVNDIAKLKASGHEVILVSSGAVGMGRQALNITGPMDLPRKQACAAVGQSRLMALYDQLCKTVGLTIAQVLVTSQDFTNRGAYLNLKNSCEQLIELGTLPIFNENDVVSVAGIRDTNTKAEQRSFDDNDKLSALVAGKLSANTLVILTNVDGVFSDNPETNPSAEPIPRIETLHHLSSISCTGTSSLGRGGMYSKLEAAKIAALCGVTTVIASATRASPITSALTGTVGTTIAIDTAMRASPLSGRERWFGLSSGFAGVVTIDMKARESLEQGNHSLLPVGVTGVEGDFVVGDVISIVDTSGQEIGRGIAGQTSVSIRKVAGMRTQQAKAILLADEKEEVVHRDNLVIFSETSDVA